ncbi:SDR family oxidoreductase [Gracilibacillus alcaliphilus]|uniref:SDR family oxidoreductase n=1 Tax=Gracilibacillus alcaliphilus TaxID=1401441 RepID=UPI00195CD2DA|nr:SDR family oxidoreductase [Gracilibacillus alcaliphilus]MBM7679684.1 NAD(P)-dependent dehydrogenase (short-subunit alcohol dehydrogenase family) [Gracilibacillus alcaliphilus]
MKFLITGANRGLGKCLTETALERGHQVFAGVRDPEADILQSYGSQLKIIQLDVTDDQSVRKALEEVKASISSLDCLINNAGILNERDKTIEELDVAQCMLAYDINTLGPIRVIQHALDLLRQGTQRSIINISSEAGSITNAYTGDYAYGLSKIALNMLSEKLHLYLREEPIDVLAIHPGWMRTDMGGKNAPTDPYDTARAIIDIAEGKNKVNNRFRFVDYQGRSMVI